MEEKEGLVDPLEEHKAPEERVIEPFRDYKERFIRLLLEKEALGFGEFTLKSGRNSPYFINTGNLSDGESLDLLGAFYAARIYEWIPEIEEFEVIVGAAYKGISLATIAAQSLWKDYNINVRVAYDRKVPKDHGEATKKADLRKQWIVGDLRDGDRALLIDDVLTTGKAKYELVDLLGRIANDISYVGLVLAVDRQEVDQSGEKSAVETFTETTGIPVASIVTATETMKIAFINDLITREDKSRMEAYLRQYGTREARKGL